MHGAMVCVKQRETKMKGVKDEDKHIDPLFPRINIREAERGGPRAPPRNKMALCEQLTMPSSHGSMPMLCLPQPSTSSNLTASSLPSHVDFHKMGLFSLLSSGNDHDLGVRHHPPPSSNGVTNCTLMAPEFRSQMPMSYQSAVMSSQSAVHCPPMSEYSMSQPYCFVNSRLGRSAVNGNALDTMEKHDHPFYSSSSFWKLQTAAEKQLNLTTLGEFTIRKAEGSSNLSPISENVEQSTSAQRSDKRDTSALMLEYTPKTVEVNTKVPESRENHFKRAAYILSTKPKTLSEAASGLLSRDRNVKPNACTDISIGQKGNILPEYKNRFHKASIHVHHDYKSLQENKGRKDCVPSNSEIPFRKRSASVMEGPSRSMEEVGCKHNVSPRRTSIDECHKDKDCESELGGTSDKSDTMSDETEVKSLANFVVSPEDVVQAIGEENFWKARKIILHQQRILAAQLFDLHRLLKVQRLMAESPETIFQENFYSRKPSIMLPDSRKLFAETSEDMKANMQESNFKIEHMPESANRKPPPLNTDNGNYPRKPPHIPFPRELIVPPIITDTKSSPLLFHPPPGNQWLVPVRSPSEGLIYKPYTGPLPPTAGILSPVYDNVAPISLTGKVDQSFSNTAYTLPSSNILDHSGLGQSYIQPYPIPAINPSGSTSTFVKHPLVSQGSSRPICNVQPHMNGIVSECSEHVDSRQENENDLLDSTEASRLVRNKVDILSLFPTTPSHHPPLSSSASDQKIQVIKVVPHNRKSASESAARIFQTIQEERKKHG